MGHLLLLLLLSSVVVFVVAVLFLPLYDNLDVLFSLFLLFVSEFKHLML